MPLPMHTMPLSSPSSSSSLYHDIAPPLLPGTVACLHFIDLLHQSSTIGQLQGLVCFDFGSMSKVIESSDDCAVLADMLLHISTLFSVILCVHDCYSLGYRIEKFLIDKQHDKPPSCDYSSWKCEGSAPSKAIDNVLVCYGLVDHSTVFRKCVCVVHHGGAGTIGTCLRVGIPQGLMRIDS